MQIAALGVDILIVLTVTVLLVIVFFQSRELFLAIWISILFVGIFVLRYDFHYSWTLVGKTVVDFAIPSAMAWAGVYLAAEVKEGRERHLWQAVFAILAILGPVIGFLVENQLDQDHKTEIAAQRVETKNDMMEAITKYNEAHPSHPLTYEQGIQLIKLSDKHAQERQKSNPTNGPLFDNTYYGHFDDDTLMMAAEQTAANLEESIAKWRGGIREIEAGRDEALYQHSVPPEERPKREKEYQDHLDKIDQEQHAETKNLCVRGEELRKVLLDRLSKKQGKAVKDNSKMIALFQQLAANGADGPKDRNVVEIAAHLRQLCNELKKKQ